MTDTTLLAPYRVLDVTGPDGWLCGRLLADLGAEVWKVEPPGGDLGRQGTEAPTWWFANRGKRSITLDLGSEAGRAELVQLAAAVDVVVESGGPGGLAALGLDVDRLLVANPRLVVTSISPFGLDGPYRDHAACDLTVAALSGQVWLTGDPDRPPVRISVPQMARHACAEATVHTLVALWHAGRSGLGQHVDAAWLTAGVRTTMNAVPYALLEGREIVRLGPGVAYQPGRPRQVYACADGHVTFMAGPGSLNGPGLEQVRRWALEDGIPVGPLVAATDLVAAALTDFATDGPRQQFVAEIEALCEQVLARRTKAELYRVAVEQRMLLAPINTLADLVDDAQLAARGYWQDVDLAAVNGEGRIRFPGAWVRPSVTPLVPLAPPPAPDEHGSAIRAARVKPRAERALPVVDGGADPFAGLKVWDMSWVGVGPLTARYLADYGATVVRLDSSRRTDVLRAGPPFKDGVPGINRSQFYADFNASKLGIGLDLDRPEGREVARRLAGWADVVVESFTPKTLQAFGLDYPELARLNPSLVMLSTCMQGQTGPNRNYRGFGQLMASLSGYFEVTGWPDRDPTMVYGAYTDFICQRFCASALIAALDHRRRTGQGQHLDLAQFEAALHFLGPELVQHAASGRLPERRGNRDLAMAPHGVYPCRPVGEGRVGERWVAIACRSDADWAALVEAMGGPAWATDPMLATLSGRRAAEDDLDRRIAAWTADRSPAEIVALLQPLVAAAPVNPPGATLDDPQLAHRGFFPVVEHTVMGPVPYTGLQARLSRTPGWVRKAAPCLGEDSYDILTEQLGYTADEVADLLASEAVEIVVG